MPRRKKDAVTVSTAQSEIVESAILQPATVDPLPTKIVPLTSNGKVATNGVSAVSLSLSSNTGLPNKDDVKHDVPNCLTKSQKKNLKKKIREKEKKAEEAAGIRRGVSQMPEDPLQSERIQVIQSVTKTLSKMLSLAEMKSTDVMEKFREQQDSLQDLLATVIDAQENLCTKIKKPDNRRLQSAQMLERIRELSALPEHDEVAIDYLEEQLVLTVSWENARRFQNQVSEIRQKIEDRQRSNQKCYDGARAWEKKLKLAERVKILKQLQPDGFAEANNVTPPKITSVEIDVNPDAQIVLLPPSNIYRRMEKVFGVAVDRPLDKIRQRTFIISGLDKDVEEAVEFLQQGDFSGGCKVSVDPRLLPQLIGKGGSGIRQLEDNFKCFFQTRENNDVVVYGARSNAAKAIEHISQMKSDRSGTDQVVAVVPVDHSAIARSLTTVFSKQIRETEVRHTVNTRVTSGPLPNPSTSPPPTQQPKPSTSIFNGPSITIRGANRAGVDGARIAITKLVSSLRAIEIPSTNDGIKRLFSRVSFNGEVDLNRGIRNTTGRTPALANQPSVGDRFCDLVGLNTDVAFMRHGDALIIVGTSDRTSKIYEEAKQLVEAAGYIIAKITIQPQQLPIFNSTRLAEIGEATGAAISIRRSRTGDSVHIEILGNESQKTQAIEMVDYVLKQEAVVEVVQIENRETLNQLLRQSGAQIHLLEEQNGIRISADRNQMTCSLVGSLSGTAETRKVLKEMDSKNAELESRSVSIPSPDMIRRLIGTKGSTISQIRATSRVDAIDVNDKNLVAILRGTTEACDEAERQIIELFSNSGRSDRLNMKPSMPGMNSSISQPSRMQSVNSPAPFGLDWGESVTADGGKANGSSVLPNCSNGVRGWAPGVGGIRSTGAEYEAFPTLGEVADIGKQTKRVHRRRRPGAKTTTTGSLHKMNVDDEDDGVLGTLTPENDGIHDGVPSPVGELHEDEQLNAVCPCEDDSLPAHDIE